MRETQLHHLWKWGTAFLLQSCFPRRNWSSSGGSRQSSALLPSSFLSNLYLFFHIVFYILRMDTVSLPLILFLYVFTCKISVLTGTQVARPEVTFQRHRACLCTADLRTCCRGESMPISTISCSHPSRPWDHSLLEKWIISSFFLRWIIFTSFP